MCIISLNIPKYPLKMLEETFLAMPDHLACLAGF